MYVLDNFFHYYIKTSVFTAAYIELLLFHRKIRGKNSELPLKKIPS